MVGRTRTCEILLIPNQAFYQLNYYHIYTVEQVGYDPTPSDFQSAAMTTSATAPKIFRGGSGIPTHAAG